jgi:hypothetical protein
MPLLPRLAIAAALLAAPAFAADAALTATPAVPGDSPGYRLATHGLTGEGNRTEKGPAGDVMAGDFTADFQKISLRDVVARFGGAIHIDENLAGWVCYVSPGEAPLTLWFASTFMNDGSYPLTGLAIEAVPPVESAGCTTLKEPVAVDLTGPGLGATRAEIEAAYGPATDVEADGTIAYTFGSENQPDGINAFTKERKFNLVDGVTVAASAGKFVELQ